jgi:tetratricopeptide (TPR) repeat protein
MVDRHYDDEALISLLEAGRIDPAEKDPHLRVCSDCRETLGTLRSLAVTMTDGAVWAPAESATDTPSAQTITTLRVFADGMAREDTAADVMLADLLAGDRRTWEARLHAHPEYRTAGMVRRLLATADRAIDTMPPDALVLTAMATEIADDLEPRKYAADTVAKLRGAAWRDRAYALYYTGSFTEAEKAVLVAESHFSDCVVGDWDSARVALLRALTSRAMDRLADATELARAAGTVFSDMGDTLRAERAKSLEAAVSYKAGRYHDALAIWSELSYAASPASTSELPGIWQNIAACHRELGDIQTALRFSQLAAESFALADTPTEALRVRWNVARMLMTAGRHEDAVRRLQPLLADFATLGMSSESALVALDLAELFALQGRIADVAQLCRTAIKQFEEAGVSFSVRATTALSYLREASYAGETSVTLVQHVRTYVNRLKHEPQLLFAPPPV